MNNIRECRKSAGVSRSNLASALRVTQQAIAKWESGSAAPKWEMAPKIARVLKCKIDDLFADAS